MLALSAGLLALGPALTVPPQPEAKKPAPVSADDLSRQRKRYLQRQARKQTRKHK